MNHNQLIVENIRDGYIVDYISGQEVKATPEEIEAVQVFARSLVDDYGYPKSYIITRPQFRVKVRPSDTIKEYPLDIAIFNNENKNDETLYIVVECKKKNRKDGINQLKDYLRLSKAFLGVWFNGSERVFLKKYEQEGKVLFEEIPNIPRFGQRLEDIGLFRRSDLRTPKDLKVVFRAIRGHLAGNTVGATRDEVLAQQLINLIFCKIYDERFTKLDDMVNFHAGVGENDDVVRERILEIFEKVKSKYKEVIDFSDKINLDSKSIRYIVGELQNYCIVEAERDVIADAFETFISGALKGGEGQFFTPRNVIKLMVEVIDPKPDELLIDPACGSGGFLVESLRYMWSKLELQGKQFGWSDLALKEEKMTAAIQNIRGIEKDDFLSKVAKAYMAIIGDGKGGIFCEDSLENPKQWKPKTQQSIELGKFDVLLTNPPFGKDIKVVGEAKLRQYDLAYKWQAKENAFQKSDKLSDDKNPQILFIERSLQLLKKGGRFAIVLPETIFHAPNMKHVMAYLSNNNNITWLIDLPHNTFRPHNNAKCIVLVLEKGKAQQQIINMAVAEEMGHDHQGKEIYRWDYQKNAVNKSLVWDDIALIIEELRSKKNSKYTFKTEAKVAFDRWIFVPRYYWQTKLEEIKKQAKELNLELVPIRKLIDEGIITNFDGHGSPPSENKGMGETPYIRVKDIVNWDVYKDPTAKVPEKLFFKMVKGNKKLHDSDIVYVRRGSYRIGSVALITSFDLNVILTREILVIRVAKLENKYGIDPFYLIFLLSHRLTQEQTKNKVLIETTLPNIGNRWKELLLPVQKNQEERQKISNFVKSIFENKKLALEKIETIKKQFGNFTT